MKHRILPALLLTTATLVLPACSGEKEQSSSAGPGASGAPLTSGAAAATGASPAGVKGSGKTVHVQRAHGECRFDFDAPEPMKETNKDGMSFTLESDSFLFTGYDGTTLHSKPEHALDGFKEEYKDIYRGTESGVQLAIVRAVKPNEHANPKAAINGMGGEPFASGRSLGCTFACSGVAAREADVVAMCKSVRVTVTADKKP